jgi:murE/murF fusion protein
MKLATLAQRLPGARLVGDGDVDIAAVREDSRAVEPGDLFVAVRGLRVDGHEFVAAVTAAGAAAVVVEQEIEGLAIPQLVVASGARALAELTAARAGDPGSRLRLVGITGTNGKTTTTYLVESILAAAGISPGVIGTVSYRWGGEERPAPYTTPTPALLHGSFAEMLEAGVGAAVLEVSSIALAMDRLAGVRFEVAAFANLTQDHLDVHGDMASYAAAKARLFSELLAEGGVAAINIDDPGAGQMIEAAGARRVLRVSAAGAAEAEIRAIESSATIAGVAVRLSTPRGEIAVENASLLGHYNIDNLCLAVAVGEALGLEHGAIAAGVAAMKGVPGRVERVANDRGLDVLVDFAHTPDALSNVLEALRPLTARRLIVVFGCGGDRDPGKRPLMGAAAAAADLVVVTSDNPRTEDPEAIIDMIVPSAGDPFYIDADRRTAIRAAIAAAVPGDIVLIAGKGHEDYQIVGDSRLDFDDREEAAAAIERRVSEPLAVLANDAGGTVIGADADISRVVIDGRAAAPGDLYVAIHGERFDGHDFCDQAAQAGAVALLVERGRRVPAEIPRIEVDDTRLALGRLGLARRVRWGRTVIGVTGSAGKTTTKELIAAALRSRHVHKSRGSHNNETGVPLTLLGLQPFHQVAVLEMGMRGLGQIGYLCEIAEPDIGVVVNAGVAHLGVIGSVEDIARGKAEMFGCLPPGGVAIYPAGDRRLQRYARAAPRALSFGDAEGADVRLLEYRAEGGGAWIRIDAAGAELELRLQLSGRHNALNACCAVAVALAAGVSPAEAARHLRAATPPPMRGQRVEVDGRRVLVDCYNSNPAALEAALETVAELARIDGVAAHAVLGDMLEIGPESDEAHREAGRRAAALGIGVVAVGEHAGAVREGAREAILASSPQEAASATLERSSRGDWVLLKASRGVKLERVLEAMRQLTAAKG